MVAVAGIGGTGPVAEDPRSIPEMVLEAVEAAVADAGVGLADVDAVVTASVDLFDGLTASNVAVTEVVGAVMKPETRIAADGLCAAIHAACQIWAGAYETVLVVAHGKASMADHLPLTAWSLDPIHVQPLGADYLVCAALQARAVAADDATAGERWAETVAIRRRAGEASGFARPCSADEVLASPIVAAPLRKEMCSPLGDAACAVVLGAGAAGGAEERSIAVTGVGHDLSPHSLGDRDLSGWEGLARACRRAYSLAGVTDPATEIDLAEPSCLYPHEEDLFLRAAGLAGGVGDPGHGPRPPSGHPGLAVSPGGGLFAGTAPVVSGLGRLIEVARQLRGGEARRAIAHGAWGPAGQGQAIAVLEGSP